MADFSFHSGRGINAEVRNSQEIVDGQPILVQNSADFLCNMTDLIVTAPGAPIVMNMVAGQFRTFGTLQGIGSTGVAIQCSSTGSPAGKNVGINVVAADYSKFIGDLGIGITPTDTLHVLITDETKKGFKLTAAAAQADDMVLIESDVSAAFFQIGSGGNIGMFGATPVPQTPAYSITNDSTVRTMDANSTNINELADVVATIIADLQALGPLG